jgi:L-ribulokinase
MVQQGGGQNESLVALEDAATGLTKERNGIQAGMKQYVIGVDYGSDSVRAVLINSQNGEEQKYCKADTNQFRQHPLDHIEGLEHVIKSVVSQSGAAPQEVAGICIDTTGSSPMPVTKDGIPLALLPEFAENPNAMMVLWKDHTAVKEAGEINELARGWGGEDFTRYEGGIYSSEWFWAKILHVVREDASVKEAAYTWMEHCDYMTYLLADNKDLSSFRRSRCAAGHKAMWHESWGGLPDKEFLSRLDPYLSSLRDRLFTATFTSDEIAGHLNKEWAQKLGLSSGTVIAVGTFDAHAGAVGARIDHHTLVRVMGTSTCDIMVSAPGLIGDKTVKGICGQVDGSVIPGMVGLEAGQSAFGDMLAWFGNVLAWPIDNLVMTSSVLNEEQKALLREEIDDKLLSTLAAQAEKIPHTEAVPVALDWVNGRRTPDANQELKSAFTGISLGTRAPHIFKALVYSICFGSRMIVERFEEEGIKINSIIGIGGVAKKSPYIMQTLANVLNRPIKVAESEQAPALGAAIYAAVTAGLYPDVIEAGKTMGSDYAADYFPQPEQVEACAQAIEAYRVLAGFVENSIKLKII